MRREIESGLGIDAVDIYGLSKSWGRAWPANASKPGWPAYLGGPFLSGDHRSRRPARVCRRLRKANSSSPPLTLEALPIIRYRTRDLTKLMPGTARTMRRMGRSPAAATTCSSFRA